MTEAPHTTSLEPDQAGPEGDWAEQMEQSVLDAALLHAPRTGWNRLLVRAACADLELSQGDEELLFPNGSRDLAALLSRRHDDRALAALSLYDPTTLKIRERIARAVSARMEAGAQDLLATRRCAAFLALPNNADLGLQLIWETSDLLWRWAGDVSTDWNHYSKRVILSGILAPALTLRWFDGRDAAEAFVARRIDNVMAFEKWKAGKDFDGPLKRAADVLAQMRYGPKTE